MDQKYKIGGASITFCDGWSEIELNSGHTLSIPWTEKPGDAALAEKLGYTSVERMNRDHDACHLLVAHMLRLPDSGPLSYAATGIKHPMWQYEEAIVFTLQSFLATSGKDVKELFD